MYCALLHKEDKMSLCGFLKREDRDMFNILTSVSGVGSKMALALLDTFQVTDLVGFVLDEEDWFLGFEGTTSDVFVAEVRLLAGIKCDKNEVGGVDGVVDLLLNTSFEIVRWFFETGSIDQNESVIDGCGNGITGRTLFACDDRNVLASEAVQEAGFTSVSLTN